MPDFERITSAAFQYHKIAVESIRRDASSLGVDDIELTSILTSVGLKDMAQQVITDFRDENALSRGLNYGRR